MASTYAVTRLLATVKHLHPVLKSIQNITLFDRILACIMREKRTRGTFSISKRDTSNRTQLANGTEFVTNDKAILSECVSFSENLFASKKQDCKNSVFVQSENDTILSSQEQSMCEDPQTERECLSSSYQRKIRSYIILNIGAQ